MNKKSVTAKYYIQVMVFSGSVWYNSKEQVRVYFEKPVYGGFHSAYCYLPEYKWDQVEGFSSEEIQNYQEYLESVAHIVIELAREGGFANAANF